MSTQVTYKGNTIANFTNDTKTLKTAGKYMEDDVTITEVIAGQGNVWQDEDGYVHLDDESGLDFQAKSVNPTESSQTVRPDAGYTALSQVTVGAISSTYVGSGITRRNSEDSNFTIISKTYVDPGKVNARLKAPEGYYASNALKTTQFDITSITDLPTQAAQTINTSTADQTITSYRWLTGTQTIKSVTTSNITAANIKSGVTVKVGDANNASRITQVTGTLIEAPTYTCTITGIGDINDCYVQYNNNKYYTDGDTFTFHDGDTITLHAAVHDYGDALIIEGGEYGVTKAYEYEDPAVLNLTTIGNNLNVELKYLEEDGWAYIYYAYNGFTLTSPTLYKIDIKPTESNQYFNPETSNMAYGFGDFTVRGISSTYVGSGVPTIPSTTYIPTTADQFISASRYLTGSQTIKGDANLIPSNIASGVSIFGVNGTHVGGITPTGTYSISSNGVYDITNYASVDVNVSKKYTATLTSSGLSSSGYVEYNETKYYTIDNSFEYSAGDTLHIHLASAHYCAFLVDDVTVYDVDAGASYATLDYDYILPDNDINIKIIAVNQASRHIEVTILKEIEPLTITENGTYTASGVTKGYSPVTVNLPYYDIYKSIANRQTIYSSASGISDFCNSFSLISSYQFAGVKWGNGLFNFDNVESIESCAFGYPSVSGIVINPSERTSMTFNNCSMVGAGAFINYNSLKEISMLSCVAIGQYAFASCSALTTISFPNCTNIDDHAFAYCTSLTTASFPSCTNIGSYAFSTCKSLKTASFSNCTSIGSHAFDYCPSLTTISFPVCTNIGSYAFNYCTLLTTALFSVCTNIDDHAFYSCKSLTTISFSVCTNIGSYAFASCSSLTTAYFPSCTAINTYAFTNCARLTTASFPECVVVSYGAFANCSNLSMVSFPKLSIIDNYGFQKCGLTNITLPACTYISYQAFISCYNLLSLYLIGSSICYLSASAFHSTPISNYTTSTGGVYGSIFVPASLYDSYKITTNWSLFASRFVSLTDAQINNVINYGRHDP